MTSLFSRYSGRFYGLIPLYRNGDRVMTTETLWTVTILQQADEPWEVADLVLYADTPLLIEWDDVRPEAVIEGSTATLRLISPGDCTFADLAAMERRDFDRSGGLHLRADPRRRRCGNRRRA